MSFTTARCPSQTSMSCGSSGTNRQCQGRPPDLNFPEQRCLQLPPQRGSTVSGSTTRSSIGWETRSPQVNGVGVCRATTCDLSPLTGPLLQATCWTPCSAIVPTSAERAAIAEQLGPAPTCVATVAGRPARTWHLSWRRATTTWTQMIQPKYEYLLQKIIKNHSNILYIYEQFHASQTDNHMPILDL